MTEPRWSGIPARWAWVMKRQNTGGLKDRNMRILPSLYFHPDLGWLDFIAALAGCLYSSILVTQAQDLGSAISALQAEERLLVPNWTI